MHGARVKNVVNELNHEKIDILEYTEDKAAMVTESLAPIEPIKVNVDNAARVVTVIVADDKAAAKAKGRKGQNVRLTARLISSPDERWDVRVEAYDEKAQAKTLANEGASELASILGVSNSMAAAMVTAGFTTVEVINGADESDLVEALGITEDEARDILNKAKNNG
jgi:N utilization substance protein A